MAINSINGQKMDSIKSYSILAILEVVGQCHPCVCCRPKCKFLSLIMECKRKLYVLKNMEVTGHDGALSKPA